MHKGKSTRTLPHDLRFLYWIRNRTFITFFDKSEHKTVFTMLFLVLVRLLDQNKEENEKKHMMHQFSSLYDCSTLVKVCLNKSSVIGWWNIMCSKQVANNQDWICLDWKKVSTELLIIVRSSTISYITNQSDSSSVCFCLLLFSFSLHFKRNGTKYFPSQH